MIGLRMIEGNTAIRRGKVQEAIKNRLVRLGSRHWLTRLSLQLEALRQGWRISFHAQEIRMRKGQRVLILHEREFIYVPMMFWLSAHYFEHIQPRSVDGREVWDFSRQNTHIYTRNGAAFTTLSLPEEDSVDAYTRHYMPRAGDLVWDAGANAGFTTYFLAQLVGPSGRVIAFEPDAENFNVLAENISRHKLENVTLVRKALDARTGSAAFLMDATMAAGFPAYMHYAVEGPLTEVETLSLADAIEAYGMPAFVKMDIEGAELAVIEGAVEVLSKTHIEWAIETNHLVGGAFTHQRLVPVFEHAGYKVRTGQVYGQWHLWASPLNSARSS